MKRTSSVADRAAGAALIAAVSLATVVTTGCSSGQHSSSSSVSQATSSAQAADTPAQAAQASPTVTASPTGPAMVSVGKSSKLGNVLVGAQHLTLYVFDADTTSKSTCSGTCAAAWPPLTTKGTPKAGSGAGSLHLGTTQRTDGRTQVTVNGHPVYYFSGDMKAGDTKGQGLNQFGAKWWVLDSSGRKNTMTGSGSPSPTSSPTSSPTGSATGSGSPGY